MVLGHLGGEVAHAVREAALAGRAREAGLDCLDDPGAPSETTSSGSPEPAGAHVLEEGAHRLGILLGAGHQVQQHPVPVAVKPQAAITGSRRWPGRMRSAMPSTNR
jgi:hypothetical protein